MTRVLRASVFDAIEIGAEMSGGIGRNSYGRRDASGRQCPNCVYGHAGWLCNLPLDWGSQSTIGVALRSVGIFLHTNDDAVEAINRRRGLPVSAPVSFADYCTQLGIVRGSS